MVKFEELFRINFNWHSNTTITTEREVFSNNS